MDTIFDSPKAVNKCKRQLIVLIGIVWLLWNTEEAQIENAM